MSGMELLSPAGDWDALVAAVENGADAVYLGGKALNARRGAGNFDDDALKRAADYLHERGKRMFVTVNTLVKQDELDALEEVARSLANAGADAAIVQDFGVARALHQMLPSLALHASTQMAVHNPEGVRYLKAKGFRRAVLARELTFAEIRACADEGMEIEVFCHGALCVACSGQCLFSSMVGGRSGNRGVCAQPCRLPYRLEGAERTEGYLLSPKDLMALDDLAQYDGAGVTSLKIEGRLKRPEYVAVVTAIYRRALDGGEITQTDREALRQIFNRGGFTRGYAPGVVDGEFISRARPSHWGRGVGQATSAREIRLTDGVLSADALVIRPEKGEDIPVRLEGRAGDRLRNPAGVKGELIRLVSEDQMAAARETVRETRKTVAVRGEIRLRAGEKAVCTLTDGAHAVRAEGWTVEPASRAPADADKVRAQFEKTGGTPYYMEALDVKIEGSAFVPASGINALRREALEKLSMARIEGARGCESEIHAFSRDSEIAEADSAKIDAAENAKPIARAEKPRPSDAGVEKSDLSEKTRLLALARDAETLLLAKEAGAEEIALFPRDIRKGHLDAQIAGLDGLYLYLPPVAPGTSIADLSDWARGRADVIRGVYITNVGQMALEWPGEKRFDSALNLVNRPALAFLGVKNAIYAPSVELSAREIEKMDGRRELAVYGRVTLMHLRHCPLNAARGGGAHADCRRCDRSPSDARLDACALVDRMRMRFPLVRTAADGGCVIDVMNSVPLSLLRHANRLPSAVRWRLTFTEESAETVKSVVRDYRAALDGADAPAQPAPNGITTGHYFRPVE